MPDSTMPSTLTPSIPENVEVVIIGAGISGLYAAWLLTQRGVDCIVLEARPVTGGRVLSVSPESEWSNALGSQERIRARFDMGPTWYWPEFQTELDRVIRDLGLETFDQHEAGDTVVEQHARTTESAQGSESAPPDSSVQIRRVPGYAMSPRSVRLVDGMQSLTDALAQRIGISRIFCNTRVTQLNATDSGVKVSATDASGQATQVQATQVLLAMPPRLVASSLVFEPELPKDLVSSWMQTPTWMAPHAKYLAVYDHPFWQSDGLSGQARSTVGPMVEIHDASPLNMISVNDLNPGFACQASASTQAGALFGFIGVPAQVRGNVSEDQLKQLCRAQFVRIFGQSAANPVYECLKDWAADAYTSVPLDRDASAQSQGHAQAPEAHPATGAWHTRVLGIASEWSATFPGYIAGGIDAAERAVRWQGSHKKM